MSNPNLYTNSKEAEFFNGVFNQNEKDRIEDQKQQADKYDQFFKKERGSIGERANEIFSALHKDNLNNVDKEKIVFAASSALSFRQELNEKITKYLNKIGVHSANLKEVTQVKAAFYSIGASYKPGAGEKRAFIEGHTAHNTRVIQILEAHIDFLRETKKNLESFHFSVNNILELYKFLA